MKILASISLSILTLSLMTAPTLANEISQNDLAMTGSIVEITPFDLVTRSYQGYLADQGIPSYGALITALDLGKVNAEDLVEKAIAKGRLAPETIDDQGYLNSVDRLLYRLKTK